MCTGPAAAGSHGCLESGWYYTAMTRWLMLIILAGYKGPGTLSGLLGRLRKLEASKWQKDKKRRWGKKRCNSGRTAEWWCNSSASTTKLSPSFSQFRPKIVFSWKELQDKVRKTNYTFMTWRWTLRAAESWTLSRGHARWKRSEDLLWFSHYQFQRFPVWLRTSLLVPKRSLVTCECVTLITFILTSSCWLKANHD